MRAVVREIDGGMGRAVAERTVLRRKDDGSFESWGDVASRVALGNALLCPDPAKVEVERDTLEHHIGKATLLMSGRHLQHGDADQPNRNQEIFTNCLSGDTKILTLEHGPVEIARVVGQTVTVKARDGYWRPAAVKSYGIQELYRYQFAGITGPVTEHHPVVTATANHRWFLSDGSVTDALKVGNTLANPAFRDEDDPEAVRHGLIFGDGSAHKRRVDYADGLASQGRDYCSIRLCGKDKKYLDLFEGYRVSYPPSASGDPVVYVGKKRHWKEVPFTTDPTYISGFIKGWWMADGAKTYDRPGIEISTSNEQAVEWLKSYAAYAGYRVVGMSRYVRAELKHPGYDNGKTLYSIRLTRDTEVKLRSIEPIGVEEVFCVEEPATTGFVLANGLLTGNCSTSATTFTLFMLLLNGSGVGRSYDDDMMLVNWDNSPNVRVVLDTSHPDFDWSAHESVRDAKHKYGTGKDVLWHLVEDSREGWAKALEVYENATFEKIHRDKLLILDFTQVRCKGSLIGGMQNRPASGPVPLMNAFLKAASIKGGGLEPWLQAMYIDHYFAECVLVGGARRAARMATKFWKDKNVLGFIHVKRPIEYADLSMAEVIAYRRKINEDEGLSPNAFLWSSNNSVTVDKEFWDLLLIPQSEADDPDLWKHAHKVYKALSEASYGDGTGEPGIINVDKLVRNDDGWTGMEDGAYVGSKKYQVNDDTRLYLSRLAKRAKKKTYNMIVNPCGEITLNLLGGYCVIADVVPFHADDLDEAEDAFRAATRALIRVNLMDCLYRRETRRTNRIGVGMTGVHEFAWKFFQVGFRDLIKPDFAELLSGMNKPWTTNPINGKWAAPPGVRAAMFWQTLARFNRAVRDEAISYSQELGVAIPHTMTTIKPAGTTSKLFGLTEGWHLPSMREFLRWVQFREDDPLIADYEQAGYPTRALQTYSGTVIVGFPTQPTICRLGMGDHLITAAEATPEEQYQWLALGERFWLTGVDDNGEALEPDYGNQISYTLKYRPDVVGFDGFKEMMQLHQAKVRCCSVMPQEDSTAFEYQPEQPVTKAEFEAMLAKVHVAVAEDVSFEHIDCATGACPIDFNAEAKA